MTFSGPREGFYAVLLNLTVLSTWDCCPVFDWPTGQLSEN